MNEPTHTVLIPAEIEEVKPAGASSKTIAFSEEIPRVRKISTYGNLSGFPLNKHSEDTIVLIQVSTFSNCMHFRIAFSGADEQIATTKPFFENFLIKSVAPGISKTF